MLETNRKILNKTLNLEKLRIKKLLPVAILFISAAIFYLTYQSLDGKKRSYSTGIIISKVLFENRGGNYWCSVVLDNGEKIQAICNLEAEIGNRVTLIKTETIPDQHIYTVSIAPPSASLQ